MSHSVIVLGCGLVSGPLIEYLSSEHSIDTIVATRTPAKAKAYPSVKIIEYDVVKDAADNNMSGLVEIIRSAATPVKVIISLLPYTYHVLAARIALSENVHFFTTSYISDEMLALDDEASRKGLLFLNECGVDPGLDHMSAMKIINDIHSKGGKVISFRSICGGLPEPSSNNNPLGYKLSWSPRGVLLAGNNSACYRESGKAVSIPGSELFQDANVHQETVDINGSPMKLEWYFNRDSIKYLSVYTLENETETIIRGTYRYPGWAKFIKAVSLLGLNSPAEKTFKKGNVSVYDLTSLYLGCESGTSPEQKIADILNCSIDDELVQKLEWLGLFDRLKTVESESIKCSLDLMCMLMQSKMLYDVGEKDMIVMKHEFEVEYSASDRRTIVSTLVDVGLQPDGPSSMARTVSLPVAIATRALLEDRISMTGVKRPIDPELYDLVLNEMAQKGIQFSEQVLGPLLWIRAEVKPGEERSPITPSDAKKLLQAGFRIVVEKSSIRCFKDDEFSAIGCEMVEAGSWVSAPHSAIIFGLKELPDAKCDSNVPGIDSSESGLRHRHLYFAHCFKDQTGWKELLARFSKGGGFLWDLEFLFNDRNCRVAAFGRAAGVVGMALGVLAYVMKKLGKKMPSINSFHSAEDLANHVKEQLLQVEPLQSIVIIGALGRCGLGATHMAELLGLSHIVQSWDLAETKAGGPFPVLLDSEIIVNCIYLGNNKIPPFITKDLLASKPNRRLEVFVDVSCDYTNPNNPFPVYSEGSTLKEPVIEVDLNDDVPLHVVAIDHLPTVIPRDSSVEFSQDLLPYLYHLSDPDSSPVFNNASAIFHDKLSLASA